jgi:hypothetical protein
LRVVTTTGWRRQTDPMADANADVAARFRGTGGTRAARASYCAGTIAGATAGAAPARRVAPRALPAGATYSGGACSSLPSCVVADACACVRTARICCIAVRGHVRIYMCLRATGRMRAGEGEARQDKIREGAARRQLRGDAPICQGRATSGAKRRTSARGS